MRLIRLLIPALLVLSTEHAIAQANYPDRPPFRVFELHTTDVTEPSVMPISDRRPYGRRSSDRAAP